MLLTRNCWYLSQASTSADEIGSHHPILSAIPIFPKIIKIQMRHCKISIFVLLWCCESDFWVWNYLWCGNEKLLQFLVTF